MRAPNGKKEGKRFIVWTKIVYDKAKPSAERLPTSPEVSEENKQRIRSTAEECNFVNYPSPKKTPATLTRGERAENLI